MKRYGKNEYLIGALVLLVILAGVRVYRAYLVRDIARERGTVAAEYVFSGGKTARAVFHTGREPRVELALSDGRKMVLRQGMSADGARYVNEDESIVFWVKGETAFLEERGERTYAEGRVVGGGRRKAEGGRRKAEGGRRKAEGI